MSKTFAVLCGVIAAAINLCVGGGHVQAQSSGGRTIYANVVALDQPFFWNRLGAMQPQGMMYALAHDVEGLKGGDASPGNAKLKDYKRPRPLVLRMNVGDTLVISFKNLLHPSPERKDNQQPATRTASIHVVGMQLVDDIKSDGSFVGKNHGMLKESGLASPGESRTYKLYAEREGVYHMYSAAAMTGGEGNGGSLAAGLFGAINVEPKGSVWYRSQVTEQDLAYATKKERTDGGQPVINYNAVYPSDHPRAGLPIFTILQGEKEIKHSDLTAIIDPRKSPDYPLVKVYNNRNDPFREFTIIYHDEIGAVQAFGIFEDGEFEHVLHSVRDAFAINYGTGGIGAEILANRIGVGPMWDCTECKYEEFFLTSWVVGDPAMVVDFPANAGADTNNPTPGPKATAALYPDDPSNVYHSYLRDHVKFRVLHAGPKEHHIHHLHAHQWLHSPDSDNSAYLDSQAIGPGSAYTMEIAYDGSGNRNLTVGDSIFHCHFYPHFAQGMWALWRVHDVFEDGSRRLPDGEIVDGTPIPAVVPMPGVPMAPMPQADVEIVPVISGKTFDQYGNAIADSSGIKVTSRDLDGDGEPDAGNPGFPFFIPGIAGHRPPHPPLDTFRDQDGYHDGGLPRHVVLSDPGSEVVQVQTTLDFTKEIEKMSAQELPEGGTDLEKVAMAFHQKRTHSTFTQDVNSAEPSPSVFITNGLAPQPGAPFADPCVDDNGNPAATNTRQYKAAIIQLDAIFNKVGWHFPQLRMGALWQDVRDFYSGDRAPEPFFFRANSGDCIEFLMTNLTPNVYELDDFQVRTPTDIMGQHIHLVKFDVTASDGGGNGWNYEDGSFSPDEVRERIHALNERNSDPAKSALLDVNKKQPTDKLVAKDHPYFGPGPKGAFKGAQTTVQRWYADDVLNLSNDDRTLRTVFTHDHFGPSTHQHPGLYAGLLVEPKGSVWRDPETGQQMGGRPDGGPTSWKADIITANSEDSYREFMFELADFQLAYRAGSHEGLNITPGKGPVFPLPWEPSEGENGELKGRQAGEGFDNPPFAINPPGSVEEGLPNLVGPPPNPPQPEAVSADDPGTMTINYRNEPVALRVYDPQTRTQSSGLGGDLSHVYRSDVLRQIEELNDPPESWPYAGSSPSSGAVTGDPFTPLLRVYRDDQVQIRVMVGATEESHNFTIHGVKWLFEPNWSDSGYRSSQKMGISEHFEFIAPITAVKNAPGATSDYLYQAGAAVDDQWNGLWGIMRSYRGEQADLMPLPNNSKVGETIKNPNEFNGACPRNAPVRRFDVTAIAAADALLGGTLVYNSRKGSGTVKGPLHDPTAILFVMTSDLEAKGRNKGMLKEEVPVEPLILRANAGDCIELTLRNNLSPTLHGPDSGYSNTADLAGFNTLPFIIEEFNANQLRPSSEVGLHPQLLAHDVARHGGMNVGMNVARLEEVELEEATADGTTTTASTDTISTDTSASTQIVEASGGDTVTSTDGTATDDAETEASDIDTGATQTVPPEGNVRRVYRWYAGSLDLDSTGNLVATPIEFGAVNLSSSDPIKHSNKGAVAALIIEPEGSTWVEDAGTRAAATVTPPKGEAFREFVTIFQNDLNLRDGSGNAIPLIAETEDSEDSGQKAINYRTEPAWFRFGFAADASLGATREMENLDEYVSNSLVGGDPETPVFTASAGTPVRFRVLHPGGHARNHVFAIHGHGWQLLPYAENSTSIGDNPLSMFEGARMGHGPSNHFDAVLQNGAGGINQVKGDYLYRDMSSFTFDGGLWGIFRVESGDGGGGTTPNQPARGNKR